MLVKIEYWVALASQLAIWVPLRMLFFACGHLKVGNWDVISRIPSGPFIIAANHISFIDPFLISHVFPFGAKFFPFRYPVYPDHYYTWKRVFMWMLGAYPMFRGHGLENASEKTLSILADGQRMLIFPEGKVKRLGRMRKARRGVAYLASISSKPIIPCYIEGFDPHKHRLGFTWKELFAGKYHLRLVLGEPFFIQDLYGKVPDTHEDYRKAAEAVMRKVYELKK